MAIVSSELAADWGSWVREKHTDSEGQVYEITRLKPTGEQSVWLAESATALAERLAEREIEELLS